MSRYLVTGGCGFIGSHLCDALLAHGHAVRVLDDLSTGRRENLPPAAELIVGDVGDAALAARALDGVSGCFHLAAIASVERGVQDWPGTHRVNLSATVGLLDAIRRLPAPVPFVYASSAAVYGDCDRLPLDEDARRPPALRLRRRQARLRAARPRRRARLRRAHRRACGFSTSMARGRTRARPIRASSRSSATGCGAARRSTCSATARRRGISCSWPTSSPPCSRRCGAGTPDRRCSTSAPAGATSVRALAGTIAGLLGVHAEIRQLGPRAGEVRHSVGDPARGRAALGLGAPTPLDRGLAATLASGPN